MAEKAPLSTVQSVLDHLRSHQTCESCGREMVCLGSDSDNPPYGKWVHSHSQHILCDWDDIEKFEKEV